ncbi:type IV secretion system DNA-binding domain-containing protein [Geotalea sp. SG265]|uniref:type IV secretion system DNA-binding domain-containing protein n=1 Tax=Geotalea sp. SG265 TaxID=2922867 RepID=UPI001FAFC6F9|nr:type IV secretion system DNA-binding domain-containing protein [Geotalea sp. SG265]
MKKNIKLKTGKRITTLEEWQNWQKENLGKPQVLLGSASNIEVVKNDNILYSKEDAYGKMRLSVPIDKMNGISLVLGGMGSGKSNFLRGLQDRLADYQQIIHDPKTEEYQRSHNPETDALIMPFDKNGIIWDIFGVIREDRNKAMPLFVNFVNGYRNSGDQKSSDPEWSAQAAKWLAKLCLGIINDEVAVEDYALEIAYRWGEYQKGEGGAQGTTEQSALSVASIGVSTLFKIYHIAAQGQNRLMTTKEIMQCRKIFISNHPNHKQALFMLNNALLSDLVMEYLSKPNVKTGDISKYSFWFLDEFLTFNLDKNVQDDLCTMSRSKGICLFAGMQYLPTDTEKQNQLTSSRYLTVSFREDNKNTLKALSELTEPIKYSVQEYETSIGSGFKLGGDTSFNEKWYDTETVVIPEAVISNLPQYVAYLEVNSTKGKMRTFILPPVAPDRKVNSGFEYSEIARNAPMLEELS